MDDGNVAIRPFVEADRGPLIRLWDRCGLTRPWNDPDRDIDRKLAHDGAILVAVESDRHPPTERLVGGVMVGYDGHRGWVNYLAVDVDARQRGLGRQLMGAVEAHLRTLGCPKINLQIRDDNLAAVAFYEALGYGVDPVRSMGKRLVDDTVVHGSEMPGE